MEVNEKHLILNFFSNKCQNDCYSFCSLFIITNAGKFLDLHKWIVKTKKVCLHFDHVGATLSFASDCSEHW